jgi:hypothetical protein
MTPNMVGETGFIRGQDIQHMQGSRCPPPAYNDHFSDLIVSAATQLDNCEHLMLSEINSARSSSEQTTSIRTMDPAPRYEQVV